MFDVVFGNSEQRVGGADYREGRSGWNAKIATGTSAAEL
jgi:hypothetical protein